jgi:hypothetical protein
MKEKGLFSVRTSEMRRLDDPKLLLLSHISLTHGFLVIKPFLSVTVFFFFFFFFYKAFLAIYCTSDPKLNVLLPFLVS